MNQVKLFSTSAVLSLVFFFTFMSSMSWLYKKTLIVGSEQHAKLVSSSMKMKSLNAELNELALQTRYGFLPNFDPITEVSKSLSNELMQFPVLWAEVDKPLLQLSYAEAKEALHHKAQLIEDLKSHTAVLRNSQAYQPWLIQKVLDKSQSVVTKRYLQEALQAVLLFSQIRTDEAYKKATEAVNSLEESDNNNLVMEKDLAEIIVSHSRYILEVTTELDGFLKEMGRQNLEHYLMAMHQTYIHDYQLRELVSQRYQGFLFVLSVALALAIIIAFVRLFITQKKLSHTNNELKFQKIAMDHHAIISSANVRGDIIAVNDKFTEVSGFSKDELLGKNHRIVRTDDHHSSAFYKEMWKTIAKGKIWQGEIKNKSKDGHSYWVNSTIVPFLDAKTGKPYQYTSVRTDITSIKETEKALNKAKSDAEAASVAKSAFLANMSHELRTPMNAIIGYSEMLMEDAEDEGYDEMIPDLQKISAAGKHLLSLINDVLDLSKIEAGQMELLLEDFDLSQTIKEVIDTTAPLFAKNSNVADTELSPDIKVVHSDVTKVRQVLFNLLSNAAKFTHEGNITIRTQLDECEGEPWLLLSVKDTGIGIPEDKIDHVFAEFSQADESTTKNYGGTGLGLPLSRKFCDLMGGDLTVTSVVGEGSVFTMSVPLKVKETQAEDEKQSTINNEGSLKNPNAQLVLVIDDDINSRDILKRTLEDDGYRVEIAESGEKGLSLARELKPDLITLDIMMPDIDGWSVLKVLKEDSECDDIPVVMVSIVADKDAGFTLGAVDSLSKPVDRNALLKVAHKHAGSGRSGLRALVVDDEKINRDLIKRYLGEENWEIDEAENGRAALQKLTEQVPDIILLDLMMPEMDGFDFAEELRKIKEYRHIPIIVVTAKTLNQTDRERLAGSVEQVIQKGMIRRADLLADIADILK